MQTPLESTLFCSVLNSSATATPRIPNPIDSPLWDACPALIMDQHPGTQDLHNVVAETGGSPPHLRDMIDQLQDRASKIASMAAEFNSTAAAVDARSKELLSVEEKVDEERKELARRKEELEKKSKEVQQMEKAVESEKAVLETKLTDLEGREERFERLADYIQGRVIRVREAEEEVGEKRRQVEAQKEEMEKGFKDQLSEFQVRFTELSIKDSEIQDKEKGLAELESKLRSREREFEQRLVEFEKREREVDGIEKRSSEVEKGLRDRFMEFMTKQQEKFNDKEREMDEKDRCVEQRLQDVILREEGFQKKEEELELMKKAIDEKDKQCSDDLKVREKRFHLQLEEFKGEEAKLRTRFSELRVKEREIEKKEMKFEQLSRDLRVKERQAETRENQVKQLEHEAQDYKKRLAQFQVYDSRYKTIRLRENKLEDGFKTLDRRTKDLEFKEKQLEKRHREVDSRAKRSSEQMQDQQFKDKMLAESVSSRVKIEPVDTSSDGAITISWTMNGPDLQIYLNERSEHLDFIIDEIEIALKLSTNPTKLVLDAMQGFYPPHLKKGDVEFEEAVIRKSCIMLLELLKKLSPEIKPDMRKEAMKLAVDWMSQMRRSEVQQPIEVLGVMQLLAAYGMGSYFEDDELISHLGVIAHYDQAPKLLQDLGLADRISSVIQKLLEKKLQAEAAIFISAFGLHTEFPSVNLTKDNEESLLGDKSVAASTTSVSGTKRPRPDACAEDGYAGCPDSGHVTSSANSVTQQLKRLKLPAEQLDSSSLTAQQPERSELRAQHPDSNDPAHVTSVEETAQHRLNLTKSPCEQPEGFNLPAQRPEREGLKSTAQQPEGLKSTAQQPEGLNISGQQPKDTASDQGCCSPSPRNVEHSGESKSPNAKVPLPPKSSFVPQCLDNGGTRLKALCRNIESNNLFCLEISDAFGVASDPAEFVLGVVKNPSTLILNRETEAVRLTYPEHGPLLLLNCMWRNSPHITPDVKKEALSFAKDWNSKLANQKVIKDNLEVIRFLLFVAAYQLVSDLDEDVFLGVFDKGHWREHAIKLFGFLGFKDFIPKFIEYLMRTNQQLEALQCINVSNMLYKSPSARDLLSAYLLKCTKKFCSSVRNFQQINQELKVWKAVVQYTEDQNLANIFKAHISTLYEQKQKLQQRYDGKAAAATLSATVASTTSTTSEASQSQPQHESVQKCPEKKRQWSSPNIQPPQNTLQPNVGSAAIQHYQNPPYGFPVYNHHHPPFVVQHPNQVYPCFPYDYPAHGR
ncbi:FRIGIDA-like protein 5 [Linum grandiflorum]